MDSLEDSDIFFVQICIDLLNEIKKTQSNSAFQMSYDITSKETLTNKHILVIKLRLREYFYRRYKYRLITANSTDYGARITIDCEN